MCSEPNPKEAYEISFSGELKYQFIFESWKPTKIKTIGITISRAKAFKDLLYKRILLKSKALKCIKNYLVPLLFLGTSLVIPNPSSSIYFSFLAILSFSETFLDD